MFGNMSITKLGGSGGNIEAIEGRVRQLESMIQAYENNQPVQQNPAFSALIQKMDGTPQGKFNFKGAIPPNVQGVLPSDRQVTFTTQGVTGSLAARQEAFQPMVEKYAQLHGVDKALVNAVIRQESGFNPAAVSKAGAQGLMQLMPGTAKGLGVENSLNPEQNIDGGVRLLKSLLKTYNGNIPLALAAYNAGGGAVAKYGGIPPYKETQNYVRSILSSYLATKQASGVA